MRLKSRFNGTVRSIIAKKTFAGYKIDQKKADDLKSDILNRTDLQKKDADKAIAIIRSASPPTEYGQVQKTRPSRWKSFKKTAQDIGGIFCCMLSSGLFLGFGCMSEVLWRSTDLKRLDLNHIQMCRIHQSLGCKITLESFEKSIYLGYFFGFALPAVIYAAIKLAKPIKEHLVDPVLNRIRLAKLDRILRDY
jgi:hypothetical protein